MGTSPPYWSLDPPSVSSCHIALADIKDAITLHFLFSVHDRFQKTWKQSVCCAWPCVYHFFCSFIPNAHIFWLSPFCLKNFNNNNSFKKDRFVGYRFSQLSFIWLFFISPFLRATFAAYTILALLVFSLGTVLLNLQ